MVITLRSRELGQSLTMRVSPDSSQESITTAASEEWVTFVEFANKFPSVLESNATYQMRRSLEESDDQPQPPESDSEDSNGLNVIPHRPGPKPVFFTRSLSSDDLRGVSVSADTVPKTDFMATWIIRIGDHVTHIMAPENSDVMEMCDRAAVKLNLKIRKWKTTVDRHGSRISVTCTSPEPIVIKAEIHFGNQEWAGNASSAFSDLQLVQEAQTQLGLEGTWKVRSSVVILGTRTIEAEKEEVEIDRPPLPRDSDVTFDFHGTKKTVKLSAGANAWDQALAAQQAFGATLMCGPIEETADTYTIQVWKPSVYPVTLVKGDERVTTWVDNTKLKTIQEEARRLFGGRPTLTFFRSQAWSTRLRHRQLAHPNQERSQNPTPDR
jgi:hypothetical protein